MFVGLASPINMLVLRYISKTIVGATDFLWCCCQHLSSFDCGFAGEPQSLVEGTTDPFRTLFVARISLDVTERKLVKEYSRFGTITKCVLIMDNEDEPRGYAFLEFEKESDMREAYKKGDGLKINGRRVLVDVERGRTVRGWLPRRLGIFRVHTEHRTVNAYHTNTIACPFSRGRPRRHPQGRQAREHYTLWKVLKYP